MYFGKKMQGSFCFVYFCMEDYMKKKSALFINENESVITIEEIK